MKKILVLLLVALGATLRAQVSDVAHSTALEAGRVLKTGRGALLSLHGYNSKNAAQYIQLHDAATVPSDLVAGVAEVTEIGTAGINVADVVEIATVDTTGATPAGLADKYFTVGDDAGLVYVWFSLDAGGTDPAVADARGLMVPITTGQSAAQLAAAISAALVADAHFASDVTDNVARVMGAAGGVRTDIAAGDSGLTVAVTQQGVDAVTAASLDGKYLTLADGAGAVHGWFDVAAGGNAPTVANSRAIAIALTGAETDAQIATAIAAALDADEAFAAAAVDATATITDAATGARVDGTAGDSGLLVAASQQGVTAIAATAPLLVITVAATANFSIELPATGLPFSRGLVVCNSSTADTKTAGAADCYFTATVR